MFKPGDKLVPTHFRHSTRFWDKHPLLPEGDIQAWGISLHNQEGYEVYLLGSEDQKYGRFEDASGDSWYLALDEWEVKQ